MPWEFIHGLHLQNDEMGREFEGLLGTSVFVEIPIKIGSCEHYDEWKLGKLFPIETDGFMTTQGVQGNQEITGPAVIVSFYVNTVTQPL